MTTIVFLHAHPDDESTQTSGSMARASAEGDRVVVVYATNGDHGDAPEDLADGETVVHRRPPYARRFDGAVRQERTAESAVSGPENGLVPVDRPSAQKCRHQRLTA